MKIKSIIICFILLSIATMVHQPQSMAWEALDKWHDADMNFVMNYSFDQANELVGVWVADELGAISNDFIIGSWKDPYFPNPFYMDYFGHWIPRYQDDSVIIGFMDHESVRQICGYGYEGGCVYVRVPDNGLIDAAAIVIEEQYKVEGPYPLIRDVESRPYNYRVALDLHNLIAHELGHALGAEHSETGNMSVMMESNAVGPARLWQEDYSSVRALYDEEGPTPRRNLYTSNWKPSISGDYLVPCKFVEGTIAVGAPITVEYSIGNDGTTVESFHTGIYAVNAADPGNQNLWILLQESETNLAPNFSTTVTRTVFFNVPSGRSYYIMVYADNQDEVPEDDEYDNGQLWPQIGEDGGITEHDMSYTYLTHVNRGDNFINLEFEARVLPPTYGAAELAYSTEPFSNFGEGQWWDEAEKIEVPLISNTGVEYHDWQTYFPYWITLREGISPYQRYYIGLRQKPIDSGDRPWDYEQSTDIYAFYLPWVDFIPPWEEEHIGTDFIKVYILAHDEPEGVLPYDAQMRFSQEPLPSNDYDIEHWWWDGATPIDIRDTDDMNPGQYYSYYARDLEPGTRYYFCLRQKTIQDAVWDYSERESVRTNPLPIIPRLDMFYDRHDTTSVRTRMEVSQHGRPAQAELAWSYGQFWMYGWDMELWWEESGIHPVNFSMSGWDAGETHFVTAEGLEPGQGHYFVLRQKFNQGDDWVYTDRFSVTTYEEGGGGPGGGHGFTCFSADTPISLANGIQKPISALKKGDLVLSWDQKHHQQLQAKVTDIYSRTASGYYLVNDHIKVTAEHPFYVQGKWVKAKDLKTSDKLLTLTGKEVPISSLRFIKEKIEVFNLTVDTYHTFYAAGVLVHNKQGGGGNTAPDPNY